MAKEEKEFKTKGWKSNKILSKLIEDAPSSKEIAKYIKSPAFTEKDYIDVMSGMYKDLNPYERWGYGDSREVQEALNKSPHNKLTTNDKAVDFLYDVLDYKRAWNKANPKNTVDLRDHIDVLNGHLKRNNLSSKKIHQLVSDPKYMLEDRYSGNTIPPNAVLKNDKIKPEHLYKYLASHPSHIDEIVSHDKSDSHLEDLIFDNPQHLKNVSNSNIEHYLNKHTVRKEGQEPRLDISGKRAKTIVEHAHDNLYDDALFKTLNSMDPEDKKAFVDRKLGITGGQPAGLASWRTNDEQTNRESEGWNDWTNGEEYDPKFVQRIAKSPHLSDDQAEHIKRHGSFDEKYELYHNKHIDPKHGVEMFKMWYDNDENKGYSSEQLQDAYKKKKDDIYTIDDVDQDLINEDDLYETADENTMETYQFDDWVRDNKNYLIKVMELDNDDFEKIDEKLRDDYDNWDGENPNFNKELDDNYQKLIDATNENENGTIRIDQIQEITGKSPKDLFISHLGDAEGNITADDIEEHIAEENPEEIDYSNHEDYSINEHPDYDDRFGEVTREYKKDKLRDEPWWSLYESYDEDYRNSDEYQEAWQENMKEAKEEAAREHYGELYASSHQDDRFIPEHLHAHIPNFEELKRNRKKAIGEPTDFLDKHIPKRSYKHPYGDEQHLHEFLKDHADANGGSIDIGRMHKLMPNQGEVWKKIFGSKGKITSDEIQGKIDGLKKTPYTISYGKWDGNKMQNINNRDQLIFRLDHSDESLKPLQEDPELYNTFKKVQEVSKRSGHPTKDNTIAWARVDTTDPDHWMIDEVQSDFGKAVTQYLKKNNEDAKANHVQKISDYHKNWREALINRVINEAKKQGASKVSTHSPESKTSHIGIKKVHSVYQDSYKKVPRKMGFKPSPAQTLPVTEKTREKVFKKKDESDIKSNLLPAHQAAWDYHKSLAIGYNQMAEMWKDNPNILPKTKEYEQYHESMADQHREKALKYGAKHDDVSIFPITPIGASQIDESSKHLRENTKFEHEADKLLKEPAKELPKEEFHEGHTYNIKPNLIKTMLDMAEDLVKFELIWNGTTNKEIKDRAKYNIDLIKNLFGYEPDLSKWKNRRKIFTSDLKNFEINIIISLPNDNCALDKSEYYEPTQEGEIHPTKGTVGKRHPEGKLMWHSNDETARKHDSIINDPKIRQKFLSKLPTKTHRQGLEALINKVAKDPNRHFIPSRDGGREKMRARHIKNLLLYPEQAKIDLGVDNVLRISMIRHGFSGGYSEWPFQLTNKKVTKNEKNEFKRNGQGRDFKVDERIFSGRNCGKYRRNYRSVEKTQHRTDLDDSRDGNIRDRISGKHLQKLQLLMKGAMKKLAPFKPIYGNEEHEAIEEWTGFGDSDSSARNAIPAMPQNAKIRALHKLGKHTEVRRHPKTGERMFLLHRGMSGDEYKYNHENDRTNYEPGTKTSWTPHIDSALGFAKDHKEIDPNKIGKVVSAWIPESEIHSVPNQVLIPGTNNQFRNEHEVIVNHMTPHPHANKKLVERARFPYRHLDTKINIKGYVEKERKSTEPPEKILHDQVAREDRAMKYREKKGIGKKENDMKTLSKADLSNKIKAGMAGMAIAGTVGLQPSLTDIKQETTTTPIEQQVKKISAKPVTKANPEKERILASIMDVESSGNKDRNHDRTPQNSIHRGERAYGSYALMPITIRETIKKHPDLIKKHGRAIQLQGSDLHNYMDKYPELEKEIASRHYDRLSKIFGHDPSKIARAWIGGITGTKKAIKNGEDIDNHWHVLKVRAAYDKHRKQPSK